MEDITVKNRGPYRVYNSEIIPEFIRLPDGRQIAVREIINRVRDVQVYNRHRPAKPGQPKTRQVMRNRIRKYTDDERLWITQATIPEIQDRYNLSLSQACHLIQNSRAHLGMCYLTAEEMRRRL